LNCLIRVLAKNYKQIRTKITTSVNMPRDLRVTLKWEFYANPDNIPQRAGIYMVLAGEVNENDQLKSIHTLF
jgi:hypothetical protein